jgi:hypothetical protein
MNSFILIIEFFGGLILLFAIGIGIGKLFKWDNYYDDFQKTISKQHKIKHQ